MENIGVSSMKYMLSQNAFNAFLKTLEEPPDYVKFILATTEKHKVMGTILSRCQVYDFKRITTEDIVHQLQHVAQNEGISYEVEACTCDCRESRWSYARCSFHLRSAGYLFGLSSHLPESGRKPLCA